MSMSILINGARAFISLWFANLKLTIDRSRVYEVDTRAQTLVTQSIDFNTVLPNLLQPGGEHGLEIVAVHRQNISVRGDLSPINLRGCNSGFYD